MSAPAAIELAPTKPHRCVSPRAVYVSLAVYFSLHVVVRLLASGTVELDESEQVLLAQDLHWGYGVQPPLYTWLQAAFFSLFGQTVLALSLLKHLLLCGTFALTYATARVLSDDEHTPVLAMLALFFVPQFAWESHRDLTHSVAATTFAAATLFFTVRILKYGRPIDYLLAGLSSGLGILAKYNFAIFVAALLIATLSMPESRQALKIVWLPAAALAFVGVTAGHFGWLFHHGASAATRDLARSNLAALQYWIVGVLSFGGLLFGLMAVIRWRHGSPGLDSAEKLVGRTLLIALTLSVLVVLVWKARFKDRWFQPILFALPLFFALWSRGRLSGGARLAFNAIALAVAAGTLIAIPVIPWAAKFTNRPTRLNLPYTELASFLRREGVTPTAIAADSRLTGGNLKLHFPATTIAVPEWPRPISRDRPLLVIWETKRNNHPPKPLVQLVERYNVSRQDLASPRYAEIAMQFMEHQKARWGYVLVPPR